MSETLVTEPGQLEPSTEDGNDNDTRDLRLARVSSSLSQGALGTLGVGKRAYERVRENIQERKVTNERNVVFATADRFFAPERPLDKLITDDKEILGQSRYLRREMSQTTRNTMNAVDKDLLQLRELNPLTTTRDSYLAYRRNRIAAKIERLERKAAASPDTLLGRHRKRTTEMFKKRQAWREGQIKNRSRNKVTRSEKLTKRVEKRDEKFQAQVDMYVNKKIEAMRRKEIRNRLKEEKIGRFDVSERNRFLAKLPAETKKRITREAILAVRESNIKKGKLQPGYNYSYVYDKKQPKRKVNDYERIT
jgi:hypothetical protein